MRERDHLVGVGIDGRIILTWILNREWQGLVWIRVVQGWVSWARDEPCGFMKYCAFCVG
jgi:hypothetical protein